MAGLEETIQRQYVARIVANIGVDPISGEKLDPTTVVIVKSEDEEVVPFAPATVTRLIRAATRRGGVDARWLKTGVRVTLTNGLALTDRQMAGWAE